MLYSTRVAREVVWHLSTTVVMTYKIYYLSICDPLRENQPYAKKKKFFFFRDFALFIPDL